MEAKNFVVYKSSAGSGKTFTLVKEYLRLALHNPLKLDSNFRRILAVTFTNKAAAEMKTRVVRTLNEMQAAGQGTAVGKILCQELAIDDQELKRRSALVLTSILHNYSDFSIGTIDSFTHRIVRTFAHELELPLNFNIELDAPAFYERVVSQLISKVGEDEYVSRLLKDLALGRAKENGSWDPEQQLLDFTSLLQKENAGPYLDRLLQLDTTTLEKFRAQFQDFIQHYKQELALPANKALELISKSGLTDTAFIHKEKGPQIFFKKCANAEAEPENARSSRLGDAIEKGRWFADQQLNNSELAKQLSSIAEILRQFIEQNYSYFVLCRTLAKQMYPLMLLKKLEEISQEQKAEDRLVFISEFNKKIYDIIQNEPAPFIYERLGERYHHYLLDEFQDTSSLQWQNILPLIDNSLANGWYNLVVGDGKQSIYRWRNADVKQFAGLPAGQTNNQTELQAARTAALVRNYQQELLGDNFRSAKNIIEFNNELFRFLSAKVLHSSQANIYHQLEQNVRGKLEGLVTIKGGNCDPEELDENTFALCNDYIGQALADGFDFRDICILCRTNLHGNRIASSLVSAGIPVVSSDSLLLRNNPEVNVLLAFLNYLVNPSDLISAASVLSYLRHREKITSDELHVSGLDLTRQKDLFPILKKAGIGLERDQLFSLNLFDVCSSIAAQLELNRYAYRYIRFFLDEANEYIMSRNGGITGFLEWWDIRKKNSSLKIPDDVNAVRIMTIHASKGLEFPVVVVPYCNWRLYKPADSWVEIRNEKIQLPVTVVSLSKKASEAGFADELEEEERQQLLDNLNLLYVAFTRPVERLHIITLASSGNKQTSVDDWLSDFLSGSGTDYQRGERRKRESEKKTPAATHFILKPLELGNNATIKIKSSFSGKGEYEAAVETGLQLHLLLSKIRSSQDVDNTVAEQELLGHFSAEQAPALKQKIHTILDLPELRPYFAPGLDLRLESELITAAGEILRPDRVVFSDEQAVIIDYKTGKKDLTRHASQLSSYEQALAGMGHRKIKKLLVYTDEPSVVEIK